MKRKTVLVTGASRGIGREIALEFSRNGYHVFLNCHHNLVALDLVKNEIEKNIHGTCTLVSCDLKDSAQVAEMFSIIHNECDALDVLVNNAGISKIGLLTDLAVAEWNEILQTNLSSVFYCCRQALPSMISKKSGKIINISSMWGTQGASCEVAYSASKSGIHGLTKALAKEVAPSNIQVNAIALGAIDTAMNDWMTPEEKQALADEIPAGRMGTAVEAAQAVYQLSQAPSYLTGQIIGLDGGY